jgi:hypothetical protein
MEVNGQLYAPVTYSRYPESWVGDLDVVKGDIPDRPETLTPVVEDETARVVSSLTSAPR